RMMELFSVHEKEISPALIDAGEPALSEIRKQISNEGTNAALAEKLILICGRIGGTKARTILLTLLAANKKYSGAVVKALYRTNFTASGNQAAVLTDRVKRLFKKCETIWRMQLVLSGKEGYSLLN